MIERNKQFIEYLKIRAPGINVENMLDLNEDALKTLYSKKVYDLLFIPGCEEIVPLYMNSGNVWLRTAALFRLANPL